MVTTIKAKKKVKNLVWPFRVKFLNISVTTRVIQPKLRHGKFYFPVSEYSTDGFVNGHKRAKEREKVFLYMSGDSFWIYGLNPDGPFLMKSSPTFYNEVVHNRNFNHLRYILKSKNDKVYYNLFKKGDCLFREGLFIKLLEPKKENKSFVLSDYFGDEPRSLDKENLFGSHFFSGFYTNLIIEDCKLPLFSGILKSNNYKPIKSMFVLTPSKYLDPDFNFQEFAISSIYKK